MNAANLSFKSRQLRLMTFAGFGALTTFAANAVDNIPIDPAITDSAMKGVVAIYRASMDASPKPNGAGFFITDRYLLTAYHVINQNATNYKGATYNILLRSRHTLTATLIAGDEYLDVALLKIVPDSDPSIVAEIKPLSLGNLGRSGGLAALGHASETRKSLFDLTFITVVNPNRFGLEAVSPEMEAGYSGGPIINDVGSVVGMALQKSDSTSVSFVRKIQSLEEFLDSDGFISDSQGRERHRDLSTLAASDQVDTLEKELQALAVIETHNKKVMETLEDQLYKWKAQVVWTVSTCEIPRSRNQAPFEGDGGGIAALSHSLIISYEKGEMKQALSDAFGEYQLDIYPVLADNSLRKATKDDFRQWGLWVSTKSLPFHGAKLVYPDFDTEMFRHLIAFNERRDDDKDKINWTDIVSYTVDLTPVSKLKEMKYFRFTDNKIDMSHSDKCPS